MRKRLLCWFVSNCILPFSTANVSVLFLGNRENPAVAKTDAMLMQGVLLGIQRALTQMGNVSSSGFTFMYLNSGNTLLPLPILFSRVFDTLKPCLVVGPNDISDDATHLVAMLSAGRGVAHVPISDVSSATLLNRAQYPTSHILNGASLGVGAAMPVLIQFAVAKGFKALVLVLDPSFVSVVNLIVSIFHENNIELFPIWLDSSSNSVRSDILSVLGAIKNLRLSIVCWCTSAFASADEDFLYLNAVALGVARQGMQWIFGQQESPSTYVTSYINFVKGYSTIEPSNISKIVGEAFYGSLQVGAARYEHDNPDPTTWTDPNYDAKISGLISQVNKQASALSGKYGPTYKGSLLQTDCPSGNETGPKCLSLNGTKAWTGFKFGLHAALVSRYLDQKGLCGVASNALGAEMIQQALANYSEALPPYSQVPLLFERNSGNPFSTVSSAFVMVGVTYPPDSIWNASTERSMGYFSRTGTYFDIDYKTGGLTLDQAALKFDNSPKRLWQGNTTEIPNTWAPDSCGSTAYVNFISGYCVSCPAGLLNPLDGSNTCSIVSCGAIGQYWSVQKHRCDFCLAGSFVNDTSLTSCFPCEPGFFSSAQGTTSCDQCDPGYFGSEPGLTACLGCPRGFRTLQAGSTQCYPCPWNTRGGHFQDGQTCDPVQTTIICVFLEGWLIFMWLWLTTLIFRRVRVQDITLSTHGVVVRTCAPHFVLRWVTWSVIRFQGTHVPKLDINGRWYRLRPLSDSCEFALINEDDTAAFESMESSGGFIRIFLPGMCTGLLRIPFVFWLALLSIFIIFLPIYVSLDSTTIGVIIGVSFSCNFAGHIVRHHWLSGTLLSYKIKSHQEALRKCNPHPCRCEKGGSRAVTAGTLYDFQQCFLAVLHHRNMYYIEPNIIRPLTRKLKLSYAELAGPTQIQWFISHFWGLPFSVTIASIKRHAEAVADQAVTISSIKRHAEAVADQAERDSKAGTGWRSVSYWCCTFSNNQWDLDCELGYNNWQDSSFYLALRSGTCRGTAMIMDEEAMPLTRSWCLFELLQTFKLSNENLSFAGLLLCTSSGVMNYGSFSMDVAHAIGNRLATLRLQDAQASCLSDKMMIDRLVEELPGGFDEVGRFLIRQVAAIIETLEKKFGAELQHLQTLLSGSCQSV